MREATFIKFLALATDLVSTYGGSNVNSSEVIRFQERYNDAKGYANHNYFTQCKPLKVERGVIYIPKTLAEYEKIATGQQIGAMTVNFTPEQSAKMKGTDPEKEYGPIINPIRKKPVPGIQKTKTMQDVLDIMSEPDEKQTQSGGAGVYVPAANRMRL